MSEATHNDLVLQIAREHNLNYHDCSGTVQKLVCALAACRLQVIEVEETTKERAILALHGLASEAWAKPWGAMTRAVEKIRTL